MPRWTPGLACLPATPVAAGKRGVRRLPVLREVHAGGDRLSKDLETWT